MDRALRYGVPLKPAKVDVDLEKSFVKYLTEKNYTVYPPGHSDNEEIVKLKNEIERLNKERESGLDMISRLRDERRQFNNELVEALDLNQDTFDTMTDYEGQEDIIKAIKEKSRDKISLRKLLRNL
jgi:hypothetical protein